MHIFILGCKGSTKFSIIYKCLKLFEKIYGIITNAGHYLDEITTPLWENQTNE